jgi:hypothetical protein
MLLRLDIGRARDEKDLEPKAQKPRIHCGFKTKIPEIRKP